MEHPPARSRSTWGHIYRRTTRTRYRKTEKEKIYLLLTQKRTSKHFASYERWEADRCQRSMPMAIASFSRFFLSSTQPCPLRSKSPGICTPRCFGIAHPRPLLLRKSVGSASVFSRDKVYCHHRYRWLAPNRQRAVCVPFRAVFSCQ